MSRPDTNLKQPLHARGLKLSGWLIYTIGSGVCASAYDPPLGQLVIAGCLMSAGLFLLHRSLLGQSRTGWDYVIQRLLYLANLLFIPGFLAMGQYGFQPGLVQITCIYGACLALALYGVSFVLVLVHQLHKDLITRFGRGKG